MIDCVWVFHRGVDVVLRALVCSTSAPIIKEIATWPFP